MESINRTAAFPPSGRILCPVAATRGLRASYYPIRAMDNTSPAGKREEVRVRSEIDRLRVERHYHACEG
ncbi:hypothetical protein N7489_002973 [Penicillium chrysogenum]|jgi:hypothetical protein|uniref:Uncharacterized protein n=1 Tax=Penicillium chrysogenum TaxID=5076 RepID=A0ABQ8W781_PENCH|nr:uncharacterized protein N7489_002973 [Penicillium chrysogenum]KAJ5252563.1 hypothetical protein N7489_002973 [Penicillium chrysogenum]KAJ5254287.1 hypothetical protein N7524_011467 [Penicillium chrysogenum]KAJ5259802.1 hypothetical protein N7505_009183 [Penicillium chrysogenum]KAJ6142332.1 hypothetical protein N7497_011431 [Penicillium chrysogenum]